MKAAAAILAVTWIAAAADYPQPSGYVNDFANQLTPAFKQNLEARLTLYTQTTTNEIAVVSVPSLNGESAESYAHNLFHTWRIGRSDVNNGVLFLWAPHERKVWITVGYGLTQVLPDAQAQQIAEDVISRFHSNDFEGGITLAVDEITGVLQHVSLPPPSPPPDHPFVLIFVAAFLAVIGLGFGFVAMNYRRGRARNFRRRFPAALALSRRRIADDQGGRLNAAVTALETLKHEAPPAIWREAQDTQPSLAGSLNRLNAELAEIASLSLVSVGEALRTEARYGRWERDLGRVEVTLDRAPSALTSFHTSRDQAHSLLPGLDRSLRYTPKSPVIDAARQTFARAQSLAAQPKPNWLLVRDLLNDAQQCLDHANGHKLARPLERAWPQSGAESPAWAILRTMYVVASTSSGGSFDSGSSSSFDSGSSSSSSSDSGGFSGGDSGGGGGGGDY